MTESKKMLIAINYTGVQVKKIQTGIRLRKGRSTNCSTSQHFTHRLMKMQLVSWSQHQSEGVKPEETFSSEETEQETQEKVANFLQNI